jgi:hypothetical protein
MVIMIETVVATGTCYWKGLPSRSLVFERLKSAPAHIYLLKNALQPCVVEIHPEITK